MNTKKLSLNLSLLTVVGLFLALSSFAADIRGKITNISSSDAANPRGSVLIEGAQEKDTNVDKAATRITAGTQIFKLQDGKKVGKEFNDLKVGQTVEATFARPVAESFPFQGTAGEIIILAEAAIPAPDSEPVVKEDAEVSLNGKLKGGMMGIGGESTGWVLVYQTKAGPRQIEVDCSGLDAGKIPEGPVHVTGKVFKKIYLERGPTLILKATKIEMNRGASKEGTVQTSLAKLCEQQRLEIQALENDREKMAAQIQRLQDEIRRLNETLDNIRSQVGNGGARPTSPGLPRVE